MVYLVEGNHFISEKQRRTAEILADLNPNLQLQWIPPIERRSTDYEFRVVDVTPGQQPYVVCFAHEADERIIAQVIRADNTRRDVNNYLDAHEAARQLMITKQEREQREADHEFAYSVLHSKKINYRHAGFNWGRLGG